MTEVFREATGIIRGARLFKGIELEGPRRGIETLFVSCDTVTVEQILVHEPKAVYFGAGRLSAINLDVLRFFSAKDDYLVMVESMDAALIEEVLENSSQQTVCVFASSMLLPDGTEVTAKAPEAVIDELQEKYPTRLGVKVDDGKYVTIRFKHAKYITPINSDYEKDEILL